MSDVLIPGADHAPTVIPWCRRCDQPVERYAILDIRSPYYMELEGQCCGVYQGIRISVDEMMRVLRTNEKVFMITRKGMYQGVGEMKSSRRPRPQERRYV